MTRNQQPATAPTRITSPTDLIAAVPYLLGFTPAESVVVVGLAQRRVAVTIRTDIADGQAALTRAMGVAFREVDRILLVAYTEHELPQWLAMPPACTDALVSGPAGGGPCCAPARAAARPRAPRCPRPRHRSWRRRSQPDARRCRPAMT